MASNRDPEEKLIRKLTSQGMSKSQAVATLKKQGLIKQSGDSLELTAKGRKSLEGSSKKKKKKS